MEKSYIVTVNGTKYNVTVEETNSTENSQAPVSSEAQAAAMIANAEEIQRVRHQAENLANFSKGAPVKTLKSPMPGQVVKINIKIGDMVKAGQVVAVIEAMKMETDITASEDGKVTAIHINPKDQIQTDTEIYSYN